MRLAYSYAKCPLGRLRFEDPLNLGVGVQPGQHSKTLSLSHLLACSLYIYMCVCARVHARVCVCIHTCTHTYTYIYGKLYLCILHEFPHFSSQYSSGCSSISHFVGLPSELPCPLPNQARLYLNICNRNVKNKYIRPYSFSQMQ